MGTPKSRKGEWLAPDPAVDAQSQDAPPGLPDTRAHALHHCPTWPLLVGWLSSSWWPREDGVACRDGKEQAGFSGWSWKNELSLLTQSGSVSSYHIPQPSTASTQLTAVRQ